MERLFLMFLDHTRQRTTFGRTPLDAWSARPEESYRLWCVVCDLETSRIGAPYIYDISSLRVNDFTLILLTWKKCWTPKNASKWQMGFNSAFKGLKGYLIRSYNRGRQCLHHGTNWSLNQTDTVSLLRVKEVEFSLQIFEKYANIKFHENLYSDSRVIPCG
jgi:hypothetical protein